ncbi:MAG: hypothetical protein QW751_01460 [Candidatus Aenigmatarchaeota archaeon]|nr:hypothetical protein [Candidatus Aenigmarchaeota archaeon]
MNGELQRLEDKVKLANLQIDKRLATLEIEIETLKKEVRNIKEEFVAMKSGQKAPQPIVQSVTVADINELAEQFKELRTAFMEMRLRLTNLPAEDLKPAINELAKRLETLEKQVATSNPIILE